MAIDHIKRLAIYEACHGRCQWCRRPIQFFEMQIDHIVAATAGSGPLKRILQLHGLPVDYDLEAVRNLTCSCGQCNRRKSDRPPADSPIIGVVLEEALRRVGIVEKYITEFKKRNRLALLLGKLEAVAADGDLDAEAKQRLNDIANSAASIISLVTRVTPAPTALHRQVDPHDWQPPRVKEKKLGKRKIKKVDMLSLLDEWVGNSGDASDEIAGWFNAEDYALDSISPRAVTRLGYAKSVDRYLVEVTFDIDYHTIDEDGEAWEANDIRSYDMWVEMNEDLTEVLDATVDAWSSFG